jgi:hypothetical protein
MVGGGLMSLICSGSQYICEPEHYVFNNGSRVVVSWDQGEVIITYQTSAKDEPYNVTGMSFQINRGWATLREFVRYLQIHGSDDCPSTVNMNCIQQHHNIVELKETLKRKKKPKEHKHS